MENMEKSFFFSAKHQETEHLWTSEFSAVRKVKTESPAEARRLTRPFFLGAVRLTLCSV